MTTNYLQGKAKVGPLTPYNGSTSVYYVEVSYEGDTLFPGTQDSYKREAQFRIQLPNNSASTAWDPSNDWSYKTVAMSGQAAVKAVNMPIYDDGVQIWGAEPNKPAVNAVVTPGSSVTKSNRGMVIRQHGDYLDLSGIDQRATAVSLISAKGGKAITVGAFHHDKLSLANVHNGVYICVISGRNNATIAAQSIIIQK